MGKNSVESEITPKKKNKKPRKMDESEGERKSKQKLKGNVDLSNKLRGGNGDKTQKQKPKLKNVNEQKRSGAGKRKGNSDTKRQKMKTNERANIKARATVNDTCLDTSMAMLKIAKDKVTNFLNQYKRMASFNKTAGKKKGKKGLFAPIANRLIDVGGGNASEVACGGDTKGAGAIAVNTILATLKACEESVSAACDPADYPHPSNTTKLDSCYATMTNFKKSTTACLKKSGQEACECFGSSEMKTMADEIKTCDVSTENKAVTAAHRFCTGNFSTCKSTEDSAGSYLYSCAQTPAALKEKAGNAAANLDALSLAKNKIDELASNSSRHYVSRVKRSDDLSSCTALAELTAKLLVMAAQAMYNPIWRSLALIVASYAGAACTAAEQSTLSTQSISFTIVIVQIESVVTSFKGSVEVSTGEEPSDEELAQAITTLAPSPTTTPAPEPVPGPASETTAPTDSSDGVSEAPQGTGEMEVSLPGDMTENGMMTEPVSGGMTGETDEGVSEPVTDEFSAETPFSIGTSIPLSSDYVSDMTDMFTDPSMDVSGMLPTGSVETIDPSMPTDLLPTDSTRISGDMTSMTEEMSSMTMEGTTMSTMSSSPDAMTTLSPGSITTGVPGGRRMKRNVIKDIRNRL